jgi:hypothetical protein
MMGLPDGMDKDGLQAMMRQMKAKRAGGASSYNNNSNSSSSNSSSYSTSWS